MQKVVGSSPISRLPRKSTSPSNRAEGQASLISPRQACAGKRSPGSQTSSGGSCTAAEKIDEGTLPSARACSTWIRRLVNRLHRFLRQWETDFAKTDRTAGAVPIAQEHIGGADTPLRVGGSATPRTVEPEDSDERPSSDFRRARAGRVPGPRPRRDDRHDGS